MKIRTSSPLILLASLLALGVLPAVGQIKLPDDKFDLDQSLGGEGSTGPRNPRLTCRVARVG